MTVLNGGMFDFPIGDQTKSEEIYELCLVTVRYGDVCLMKVFLGELLRRDAEDLSMGVIRNVFATAERASSLRCQSLLVALKDVMSGYDGDNDTLRCIGENCFKMHPLRITAESLLEGTKYESSLLEGTKYESGEYLAQLDNVETGAIDNGCLVPQGEVPQGDTEVESTGCDDGELQDERLVEFLRSFIDKGTAFVTVGYKVSKTGTGAHPGSGLCCVRIEKGTLSEENAQEILGYLDALGIKDALPPFPEFEDDWNETYILKDRAWRPYKGKMGKEALYLHCKFYSGIKDC